MLYEAPTNYLLALQCLDDARQPIREAQERKLDDVVFHYALYGLAFQTGAFTGHLGKARELTKRAVDSAIRSDSKETGAIWWENVALREAAFGNSAEAKQVAAEGVKLYPASQAVEVESALGYAMTSDSTRALWHKT